MKRTVFLALLGYLLLTMPFHLAAWNDDPVVVRTGRYIEWETESASLSDGVALIWSEHRDGLRKIICQKLDDSGNPLWGNQGVVVSGQTVDLDESILRDDSQGSVFVVWRDTTQTHPPVAWVQKLDAGGTPVWSEGGVLVSSSQSGQSHLQAEPDGSGGLVVTWVDVTTPGGTTLYGARLDDGGNHLWDPQGVPVATNLLYNEYSIAQVNDSLWVIVYVASEEGNDELRACGLDLDDGVLWDIPVTGDAPSLYHVRMCTLSNGAVGVVWQQSGTDDDGDIFARCIDTGGNLFWDSATLVCDAPGDQWAPQIVPGMNDGSFIVAWFDSRDDTYTPDGLPLFAQKIMPDGSKAWDPDDICLASHAVHREDPAPVADGSGGMCIAWSDTRAGNDFSFHNIYAQYLSSAGTLLWDASGVAVCDADEIQSHPVIVRLPQGFQVAWSDRRNTSTDLYTQTILETGEIALQPGGVRFQTGLDGDVRNHSVVARNGNPVVSWVDYRNDKWKVYLQRFDTEGTPLFPDNGMCVTLSDLDLVWGTQDGPVAVIDPAGNTAVLWRAYGTYNQNRLGGQLIDPAGQRLWGEAGLDIVPDQDGDPVFSHHYDISAWGENDFVILYDRWIHSPDYPYVPLVYPAVQRLVNGEPQWGQTGSLLFGSDVMVDDVEQIQLHHDYIVFNTLENGLRALRIGDDGSVLPAWQPAGVALTDSLRLYYSAVEHDGILIVAWRRTSADIIRLQALTGDAQPLFPEDGLALNPGSEVNLNIQSMVADDDAIYVTWKQHMGSHVRLFIQKAGWDMSLPWGAEGLTINPVGDATGSDPIPLTQLGQNLLIAWSNVDSATGQRELRMQLIAPDGTFLWEPEGRIFFTGNWASPHNVRVTPSGDGHAFVSWKLYHEHDPNLDESTLYTARISPDGTITGPETVPAPGLILMQNQPNPFNPETRFRFSLPASGPVRLDVYNIRGQLVKTLVDQHLEAGEHSLLWNGTGEGETPLASGVYFYRLRAGGSSSARKCLLMK